jgi:membrane associated rhomboid family serine protease
MLPLYDNVPVRRFPVVTYALIAANFAVWFWELGSRGTRLEHYAFYPCAVSGPCIGPAAQHHLFWVAGAFSGMFLHASWLHILGNMLFLWIFGNNVEAASASSSSTSEPGSWRRSPRRG